MVSNCLAGSQPKGIQSVFDNHTLEDKIAHMTGINRFPSNILALTIWALKRGRKMISWAGLLETDFVF
jgi:hypothetical protein